MEKLKKVLTLFITFFKIGLFTFGGGYAMISIIENEFVSKKQYLSHEEFIKIIAVAESTPGPIAVNSATYIGYKQAGVLGSLMCTLGVVLPSFIIIFTISKFLDAFMRLELVRKAFRGIQCGIGVLICSAAFKMIKKMKITPVSVITFVLTFIIMVAVDIFAWNFSSVYLVFAGLVLGVIITALSKKEEVES